MVDKNEVKSYVEEICKRAGETLKENSKVKQVDFKEDKINTVKTEFTYLIVGDQKDDYRNKEGSNWVEVCLQDNSWEDMNVVLHYYDDGMTGVEKERKLFRKPLEVGEYDIVNFINTYF